MWVGAGNSSSSPHTWGQTGGPIRAMPPPRALHTATAWYMPVSSRDLDPDWVTWRVQGESWRKNGRMAGPGSGLRWNVRLLQGQIQAEGPARVGGEWPLETVRFRGC